MGGDLGALILSVVLMLAMFYLLVFIPENRRKKKYNAMINSLKLNDEIMTKGGIIGKITSIEEDYILLQTGPDRARIKLSKQGISHVINESKIESKTEEKNENKKVKK
ncbi:MAG: preprotein translocase subunit YajC [Clostridiales bacterium]|uniref:preprotein translocase subunit YajC n=1 Tax=Clostridium sp. N3C TaxID=1776758 RepID=UPI00092DEAAA|nr:preprotein translocase subunit YajC [Clostridium sp. N3C]NLZ48550.1 preprotein translocase subunit YajC [Clostridiales bacterium]SCN21489.1 preprotein translocase subunit YajC [Clostridium sp. N3C]